MRTPSARHTHPGFYVLYSPAQELSISFSVASLERQDISGKRRQTFRINAIPDTDTCQPPGDEEEECCIMQGTNGSEGKARQWEDKVRSILGTQLLREDLLNLLPKCTAENTAPTKMSRL